MQELHSNQVRLISQSRGGLAGTKAPWVLAGLLATGLLIVRALPPANAGGGTAQAGGHPESVTLKAGEVQVKVTLASNRATVGGAPIDFRVDFDVAPGWHLYGGAAGAEGFVPTSVSFEPGLGEATLTSVPAPTPVKFEGLGETLPVYQGKFSMAGKLVLDPSVGPGADTVSGKVRFQECSDVLCKLPSTLSFALPLEVEPPGTGASPAG